MNTFAWEEDFPKGFGHTSIAFLKRCIGFNESKNGNLPAALFVVSQCVKRDRIQSLREQYPDAILLPVLGKNQLPLALAMEINLPIWFAVILIHVTSRKCLSAFQRLIHKPVFVGTIQCSKPYILIDDVVTQGGTLSALREFVLVHGGTVVAVVALAFAIGSHAIAPLKRHIVRLLVKFGTRLCTFLQEMGVVSDISHLTNSQARYLLRFSSVRNMERKLLAITH